jgi:phosphoglycerate dehydrogenase-like enzyme
VSREAVGRGFLVTNWGSIVSRGVAESALMMILMCLKRTAHWHEEMHRHGAWRDTFTGEFSLFERRVGIHGFGRVAQELTKLLGPFGAKVATYSPYTPDDVLEEFDVARKATLEALFAEDEIIVELAALTEETKGSVNRRLFDLMPDNGVFVNVGRGKLVDEASLIDMAREGRIRIAVDVYHEEPLPTDDELRSFLNVVLLPHIAGPTIDRAPDAGRRAAVNIERFFAGEEVYGALTVEDFDCMT